MICIHFCVFWLHKKIPGNPGIQKKSRDFKNAVNWVGSRDPGKDLLQIEVLHDHFEPLYYSIVPKSYWWFLWRQSWISSNTAIKVVKGENTFHKWVALINTNILVCHTYTFKLNFECSFLTHDDSPRNANKCVWRKTHGVCSSTSFRYWL